MTPALWCTKMPIELGCGCNPTKSANPKPMSDALNRERWITMSAPMQMSSVFTEMCCCSRRPWQDMSRPHPWNNRSYRRYPAPPRMAVQPCVTTVLGPGKRSSSLRMNITDAGPMCPR